MMEVETIIEHGKSSKLLDLHQEDIEWINIAIHLNYLSDK